MRNVFALALVFLAGCAYHSGPLVFRSEVTEARSGACRIDNGVANQACEHVTPELSSTPPFTLHFVEFDDQGWLYPAPGQDGYVESMGAAHRQLDAAIDDLQSRLKAGPVLLVTYMHGWKHSAFVGDTDVQKFREILTDITNLDRQSAKTGSTPRQVVGIYVAWQGNSFPASEPFSNLTFWGRKDTALRVAAGSARELFARIRALRAEWNSDKPDRNWREPRLRAIAIGHSFGAQIAFTSLSPSILTDLAFPIGAGPSREEWRKSRAMQTVDVTILVNPAFEASAYEPLDRLARQIDLHEQYEPPVLVTITSADDMATGKFFPLGRRLSTGGERPFTSREQESAVLRTPGFIDRYHSHTLAVDTGTDRICDGWSARPSQEESAQTRSARDFNNMLVEAGRHAAWTKNAAAWTVIPDAWEWSLCGGTVIKRWPGAHADLIWNVVTDKPIINGHNGITGDAFISFVRQVYLDVIDPPPLGAENTPVLAGGAAKAD